ncbi:MAG: Protein/nucleotide deglycase [Candidatus Alkanophagales archaeon MCA70_species_1]|nr:Protein/nucleotide deglycase [Candidatus Alkanophaga volatiphilum]
MINMQLGALSRDGRGVSRSVVFLIVAVVATALLGGCVERQPPAPSATPAQPLPSPKFRILMVIAPEDFRDEELFVPKAIFEEHGATVEIASTTAKPARGMLGAVVEPDVVIPDVTVGNFDAIVVVGGTGSMEYLWDDSDLHTLIRDAYDAGKVVAAICLSPVVLARAGVLEGKKATVFPSPEAIEELEKGGATYVDEEVVTAGNVITARDPESAEDFALTIWAALCNVSISTSA